MNLYINMDGYDNEMMPLLKVFYPGESIHRSAKEQSPYRILLEADQVTVAYFDGFNEVKTYTEPKRLEDWKLQTKQLLFDLCTHVTGKDVHWGVLNGIRPTKLAFKLYKSLGHRDKVVEVLCGKYRLSPPKAHLLMDVIEVESQILANYGHGHSIYIGVPFCPSKCAYCTFPSYQADQWQAEYASYAEALINEIDAGSQWFSNCESIYIGGGTPTSLTDHDFDQVVRRVRHHLGPRQLEFTVEAGRPDSISENKLRSMVDAGVNRISINPQTMCDITLKAIGRSHDSQAIVDCFDLARKLGFDHINMDLILGLPGETIHEVRETLKKVIDLGPESITVHTLAYKRGSKLSDDLTPEKMARAMDDSLKLVEEKMAKEGYRPYYLYRQKQMIGNYENVGYCQPGHESVYNILIMEEVSDIVAFGAGAISKRIVNGRISRLDQPKDVRTYLGNLKRILEKKENFFKVSPQ